MTDAATPPSDHTRSAPLETLSPNERMKAASRYLRGTILESLADTATGAVPADDGQLLKFHGTYLQDDRDLRRDLRRQKLEPAYSFMIRVRVPGGVATPKQWLEMDRLAGTYANETIKLTTRQAFQFHGVIKRKLKQTIQEINLALLDTIAACGDVNRNVMCNPNPWQSKVHPDALRLAQQISNHLTPQSTAYHEIWLTDEQGGEPIKVTEDPQAIDASADDAVEPIYGKTYLPRKFKIVVAVPPSNDVDIFAHDLGFIAIVENDRIVGYNVTVGGGMGMSHSNKATFPRLAEVMAFVTPDEAVTVAEKIVLVQRDFGDRANRAHARLKYTIDDRGLAWFRAEVEARLGHALEDPRPFAFDDNGDRYGWVQDHRGHWHFTLFVQNGRVKDIPGGPRMRAALREIAAVHTGDFRLTANQNLIIADIAPENKEAIAGLLEQHGLLEAHRRSALRLNSMACVALPTCGLALAEAERFLPDLLTDIEGELEQAGLRDDAITIRMTGCPNGCARPFLAEIAFVGRAPGKYNMYLGGGFHGQRLNKLFRDNLPVNQIVPTLRPLFHAYATRRQQGERFGDFLIRDGVVQATVQGADFHHNIDLPS